ncbi:hypothetical protein VR41_14945, partial [Streptomyces sp. NRRL B-1568]
AGKSMMKLRDILGVLRDSNYRTTGIEFMLIQGSKHGKLIQARVERPLAKPEFVEQLRILRRLHAAAGAVAAHLRHVERVGHHALAREGHVAVELNRQDGEVRP